MNGRSAAAMPATWSWRRYCGSYSTVPAWSSRRSAARAVARALAVGGRRVLVEQPAERPPAARVVIERARAIVGELERAARGGALRVEQQPRVARRVPARGAQQAERRLGLAGRSHHAGHAGDAPQERLGQQLDARAVEAHGDRRRVELGAARTHLALLVGAGLPDVGDGASSTQRKFSDVGGEAYDVAGRDRRVRVSSVGAVRTHHDIDLVVLKVAQLAPDLLRARCEASLRPRVYQIERHSAVREAGGQHFCQLNDLLAARVELAVARWQRVCSAALLAPRLRPPAQSFTPPRTCIHLHV